MTPQEKAKELVDKFRPHSKYWDCHNDEPLEERHANEAALICVDVVLSSMENEVDNYYNKPKVRYWEEVKKEINKL